VPGLVNVDFADVRAVMTNAGSSLMGQGRASGQDRCGRVGARKSKPSSARTRGQHMWQVAAR
jgi:cell division GTPase FtsZ